MNAGSLNQRIQLQRPTSVTGDAGETTLSYSTDREVWAEVRPLRAHELDRAQQIQMETTHIVRIRYVADVAPNWRVVWRERVLNISAVIDVGARREELELTCQELNQ